MTKHCDNCRIEVDTRLLRDPETCPECGNELHEGELECDHKWIILSHGTRRCELCGEIDSED